MLPSIIDLKSVIDEIKSISSFMTISANMNGVFKVNITNDYGEAESLFDDLSNPELG